MSRSIFSHQESLEIKSILQIKCNSISSEQKKCRYVLRGKYDFNISDFGNYGKSGMTPDDFSILVECGKIIIK